MSVGGALYLVTGFALVSMLLRHPHGHALLAVPNQRGALATSKFVRGINESAPRDPFAHFPAGEKAAVSGIAVASQVKAAGKKGWNPFLPLEKDFVWRAGVCGDQKGARQDHLRGGKYYFGGKVVQTHVQGGILAAQVNLVSNHGGFFEFHVCDVSKCGGEISERCFRNGHCQQLQREPNPICDNGRSRTCAPIDPHYPGRWYLPCSPFDPNTMHGRQYLGGNKMLYRLPKHLHCEHCVLQWFWSTSSRCNPPGMVEFFTGRQGPQWGKCKGQGGAVGGVNPRRQVCNRDNFPQEYLQCADISILRRSTGAIGPTPHKALAGGKPTATPSWSPIAIGPALPMTDLENNYGEHGSNAGASHSHGDQDLAFSASPVPESQSTGPEEWGVDVKTSNLPELDDATPRHTTDPSPDPSHTPRPSRPSPIPKLAIPPGYPEGVYGHGSSHMGMGSRRASVVAQPRGFWESYRWASGERARRGRERKANRGELPEAVTGQVHGLLYLPGHSMLEEIRHLLERDGLRWARAELARRENAEKKPNSGS